MSYQDDRRLYLNLLKVFLVLALTGMVVLVYTSFTSDSTNIVFSLIAFMISVAALMMTTLQSLSISRQMRITERSIKMMHAAEDQLEALTAEDKKLGKEIHQDLLLDRKIVEVLEEVGVGDNAEERHEVARRVAGRVRDI